MNIALLKARIPGFMTPQFRLHDAREGTLSSFSSDKRILESIQLLHLPHLHDLCRTPRDFILSLRSALAFDRFTMFMETRDRLLYLCTVVEPERMRDTVERLESVFLGTGAKMTWAFDREWRPLPDDTLWIFSVVASYLLPNARMRVTWCAEDASNDKEREGLLELVEY